MSPLPPIPAPTEADYAIATAEVDVAWADALPSYMAANRQKLIDMWARATS